MLLQPLTGYVASSLGSHGVVFFGLTLPAWAIQAPRLRDALLTAHHAVALLLVILIGVHVMAALKDLLFDGRSVVRRMLPRIPER